MRWTIAHLILVVFFIALALGIHRAFWGPGFFNARIVFASNVALLTTSSIGAYYSRARWRRAWLGYALFGWVYLVVVLRGGFGFVPDVYADLLAKYSIMGIGIGILCAIAACFLPGMERPSEQMRDAPPKSTLADLNSSENGQ